MFDLGQGWKRTTVWINKLIDLMNRPQDNTLFQV